MFKASIDVCWLGELGRRISINRTICFVGDSVKHRSMRVGRANLAGKYRYKSNRLLSCMKFKSVNVCWAGELTGWGMSTTRTFGLVGCGSRFRSKWVGWLDLGRRISTNALLAVD